MGDKTSIEWTEATWNPVRGCSRVSRGCENCYAEGVARRFAGVGQPYEGLVRIGKDGKAKAQWNGVVRVVSEHLADPLRWTRPRMVFVNSMSDLFHESLAIGDVAAIFAVMAHAPQHTFQVLTKRPKRMRELLSSELFWTDVDSESASICCEHDLAEHERDRVANACMARVLPNVWLGVSVEDQATADERIPHLLACPAAVRFVSYEPALGPVDLRRWVPLPDPWGEDGDRCSRCGEHAHVGEGDCAPGFGPSLDWVIVGGESGPGARPFDLAWARGVVTQCRDAGVACFVKQLGAKPGQRGPRMSTSSLDDTGDWWPTDLRDRKGGDMSEWPEDLRVREMPEVRP